VTFEVQQTRWDRIVRRVSGSIGPGSRVGETLGELFPTLDIELVPGELLALGGTKLCIGAAIVTNVALMTSRAQIFNPVDSGNIITITAVELTSNPTQIVNYAVRQIALTTVTALERFRDGRFPTPERPVGQVRTENSVAQTDPDGITVANNVEPVSLTDPNGLAVLPPGSGYEFGSAAVNTDMRVTFRWRERPAEESELSL